MPCLSVHGGVPKGTGRLRRARLYEADVDIYAAGVAAKPPTYSTKKHWNGLQNGPPCNEKGGSGRWIRWVLAPEVTGVSVCVLLECLVTVQPMYLQLLGDEKKLSRHPLLVESWFLEAHNVCWLRSKRIPALTVVYVLRPCTTFSFPTARCCQRRWASSMPPGTSATQSLSSFLLDEGPSELRVIICSFPVGLA